MDLSGEDGDESEGFNQMSTSSSGPKKPKKAKQDPMEEALMMAISEVTKPKDEHELFGEIVAQRLTVLSMRHPLYAAQARHRIDQILMEFEYSPEYQDPNPNPQILMG